MVVKYSCVALALWVSCVSVQAQIEAVPALADTQTNVMFNNTTSDADSINDDDAAMQANIAVASEMAANTAMLQGDNTEDFDRD